MASMSAMPGMVATWGAITMKVWPSAIMRPHAGVGGGGPSPRKDSPDSVMMAPETRSAPCTMMGASTLGSTCWKMMAKLRTPAEARRLDVGLLLHGEDVAARHPRERRDEAHRHRDDHVAHAEAHHRHHGDGEDDDREREEPVHDPHDHGVHERRRSTPRSARASPR